MLKRAPHGGIYLTNVQGLGDVIKRAGTHRLDRIVDSLLPANHHHHRVGRLLEHARDQLKSADPSHVDVADHEIETFIVQHRQRVFGRSG